METYGEENSVFKEELIQRKSSEQKGQLNSIWEILPNPDYQNQRLETSSEIESEDRIRTSSGSLIPKKVQNIRNYFDQKEAAGSEKSITNKETTQPKKKAKIKVKRSIAQKLRTQAKRLVTDLDKACSGRVITGVNKKRSADCSALSDTSLLDSTSESDTFITPKESVSHLKDKHALEENRSLSHLPGKFKMPTDDELNASSVSSSSISVNNTSQSKETVIDIPDMDIQHEGMETDIKHQEDQPPQMLLQNSIEENMTANPEVMSVAAVLELFNKMRQDMNKGIEELTEKVNNIQVNKEVKISQTIIEQCKTDIAQAIDLSLEQDKKDVVKLKADLKHFKFRNRALTNVVQNMATEITDLKARLENLELSGSRNAVTITGLYLEDKKKTEVIYDIENWIQDKIGVSVCVEDYYRVGADEPKLTVVFFQNAQQKRDTLHFKKYLKDYKNRDGKKYYINDYIPAGIQERRKRDKDIFSINENLEKPVEVKYTKGKLSIAGEIYKPKISTPSPKDIVDHTPESVARILKMKLEQGAVITQEKSVFTAYTACVDSYDEIRDLYVKMKLIEPAARHIVCAYWIKGDGNAFYNHDFCDDDEPSAGRNLLNILLENDIENRVIFVARKYGGIKMGPSRFQCYREAALSAIIAQPWNSKLGTTQSIKKQNTPRTLPHSADAHEQSGQTDPKVAEQTTWASKRPASSPAGSTSRGRSTQQKRPYRGSYGRKYAYRKSNDEQYQHNPRGGRYQRRSQQDALNSLRGSYSGRSGWNREQAENRRDDWPRDRSEDWSRDRPGNWAGDRSEDWSRGRSGSFYTKNNDID